MLRILSVTLLMLGVLFSLECHGEPQSDLKMWAVEASTEGKERPTFDKGLESITAVLAPLPHNVYRKVSTGTHRLSTTGNTRININKTYTLETASPVRSDDGRYRIQLRILMPSTETPEKEIKALDIEVLLKPDKQFLVRGLKLEKGKELVLVLSLSVMENNTSE